LDTESDPFTDVHIRKHVQRSDLPITLDHNLHVHADPAEAYRIRLSARRLSHEQLTRTDRQFSYARLAVFGLGALVLVAAWQLILSIWLILVPIAAFIGLVRKHERVIRQRDEAARAIAFYERGLARIEDRWAGTGEPGERFRDDNHLYANDLDLFGHGSLFELLSIARTRAGEAKVAAWLLSPATPTDIAARQEAVAEFAPLLDLRETLSLAGTDVAAGLHGDELVRWAETPPLLTPPWARWIAVALTAAVIVTAALWLSGGDEILLQVTLAIQVGFAWPQQRRVERALHRATAVARDLDILGHLLEQLERQQFSTSRLRSLRQAIYRENDRASAAIRSLHRLVELHDWQHNLIFLILSLPFMWGTHVAWAIEAWRARHGVHIRGWLDAVAEFEALSSLSAFSFEHPRDPFPAIVTSEPPSALFDGADLGHPLLPADRCVRNDVRLDTDHRLLVISGSNMSGKSTLLRTVGINAVLAQAGAPVRAASLRLSPLRVGATLRIQDSLQAGRSRFYAEITRVRALAEVASGSTPLLFLLDELLHGTNSHDRLVGASGVLRSLLNRGAIGLVTTHDLALTSIVRALAPRAVNVHFEDWFDEGEIRFDYRMKPGPVTRSNAIALMRAVGLDVPADPDT
jgi:MutS domain V